MARRNNYKAKSFSRGHVSTSQTEQHLKELGDHVLQAAKDALKKGADEIVNDAKSRCPVYEGHKKNGRAYFSQDVTPGALRDSIKAESKRSGTIYQISANAKSRDGYLYGQIVEFSPRVNRPFLYPAMEAHRDSVRQSVIQAIQAAVKRK